MHRSRLSVLVIFAAVAACSKRDDSEGIELLSQDRALVERLEINQEKHVLPLPGACGTVTVAAQPAAANQRQAEELTRQAKDAEMHGNLQEARSLLRRASELDGTNKSTAYHLGRTSETLGDRTAALNAYCHYLALAPATNEAAEARQRVTSLSQPVTRVSAGSVTDSVPATRSAPVATAPRRTAARVTRAQRTVEPRVVASAPVQQAVPAAPSERSTGSSSAATGGTNDSPAPSEPVTVSSEVATTTDSTAVGGNVVATSRAEPAANEPPSTAPSTRSRGPNRAQSAGIGAATGAIIGAVSGRSVKSAVIGAAAGGILGSVVGRGTSPMGRGIVPYARQ